MQISPVLLKPIPTEVIEYDELVHSKSELDVIRKSIIDDFESTSFEEKEKLKKDWYKIVIPDAKE